MNDHRIIRQLVAEVRKQRERIDETAYASLCSYDASLWPPAQSSMRRAAEQLRMAKQRAAEAQHEAQRRQWDKDRTLYDLKRARESGDEWMERRALERLMEL